MNSNRNHPKQTNFLGSLFKRRNDNSNQNKIINLENTLLNYYTSFIQNHPDVIIVLSPDGQIVSHNTNSIQEQLGYSPKQTINYKELISEEYYNLLKSSFKNAMKGITGRVEFSVFNKQGERLDLFGTFIPIEQIPKKTEGIFLVLKNITNHKLLERSNKLYASHLDQAQQIARIGSFEYFIDKDEVKCSNTFPKIFGLNNSKKISLQMPLSLIHPDDYDYINKLFNMAITKGVEYTTEYRIFHGKTGELRYIKVILEVEKEKNRPFKLIGIVKDFTEQKKLDIKLKETNKDFQHIFDHLHVGIWMRESIDGNLTFASQYLEELLQVPLSTLYKNPDFWKDMVEPSHQTDLLEKYKLLSEKKQIEHSFRLTDGKGVTKWVYEQTIPRVNEAGEITHLFGMVMDISSDIERKERIEFLAKNDALTALPNLQSLHDKLGELISCVDIHNFALLCMDLDNFNTITNYLGYKVGDVVLQKIANRLAAILPSNSYLAKASGDSFMLIIQNYRDKETVFQLAKKIIQVGEKVIAMEYELHITASLGISFYPDNGNEKLILLEHAHTALYHAKKLGKNNVQIYSFDRDISSHKKYLLEMDLRKAIQDEDFELYYQPFVNPKNGVIVGAEALIRWNHKDWGIISPNEFIPLAEEKHLIHHIGEWVIQHVCRQLRIWKEKGYTLYPIAINISPMHFLKPGLVDMVKNGLEDNQIPGSYLELEITESTLIRDVKIVSTTLKDLKELGVRIALDDFGTGYTSFDYLQKFNLDTLKIDQLFMQNLELEDSSKNKEAAIVSSILHLAKGLNMRVIAEGVEEYEQLEFLKQKECDIVQGFLFSKPVPVDKFEQMMKRRYLNPRKQRKFIKPKKERRKYFRFVFPSHLPARMVITEVNRRKVQMGSATILVENISLGGIRFLSELLLPVTANIHLKFHIEIMNKPFEINGFLVYKNEEKHNIFSYGVSFQITEGQKDELAEIINKMTLFKKWNNEIPNTNFIGESPYSFLRNTTF